MNFDLHFAKSHKYHVAVSSQIINDIEASNPSQGTESTAYLVVVAVALVVVGLGEVVYNCSTVVVAVVVVV